MRIGLDLDGVLIDHSYLKRVAAYQLFGTLIPAYLLGTRATALATGLITAEEYDKMLFYTYENSCIADAAHLLPDAADVIQELTTRHSCCVVTARYEKHRAITTSLLTRVQLSLPVIHTNGRPKGPYCKDIDVFVDDDTRQIESVIGIVPHPILFEQPYNSARHTPPSCTRTPDWKQLGNIIRKLALSP